MLKRERTTLDLLKPITLKETDQCQQEKQVQWRERRSRDRVFTSSERVLARNYSGEPKWIPATVIAQTRPVSYIVQTNDNVWRRHLDQLLATSPVSSELSPEPSLDVLDPPPVFTHTQVQQSTIPETVTPAADVAVNEAEAPVVASASKDTVPHMFKKTDVPAGRWYPARERRPPVRMDL